MIDLKQYSNLTVYQSNNGESWIDKSLETDAVTIVAASYEKLLEGLKYALERNWLTVKKD